jgi:hypothetical protein
LKLVNTVVDSGAKMDPVTLFALANGAVSAVKAGCQLYKEIKGAAGDVKEVLKDLDDQFHKRWEGKAVPVEAKNQYIKEKNRVIDLNKKGGETTNIYQEIGQHLGAYFDNYYKCLAIFEEEERRSKNEVYTGEDSLGKRALQRVLMKKQLEHMATELREIMVYQSPPELGALWTDVEEMMKTVGKEQKFAIANQMKRSMLEARRKALRKKHLTYQATIGILITISIFAVMYMFMLIIDSRIERYPELGNCAVPKGSILYKEWTNLVWSTCE